MNEAYRRIITAAEQDRRDLFVSTARRIGTTEQNAEKDFWVCWTLDALFHGRPQDAPRLLFKGGTSLSKAFGLIRRFSEDIDITIFRHDLGEPISIDDLEKLSGKKQSAKLDEIRATCQQHLRDDLGPQINRMLIEAAGRGREDGIGVVLDAADPDGQTLLVQYPSSLPADTYVRSAVRIECGAKSALDPHVEAVVQPYASDDVPDIDLAVAGITTIQPTRTFWDKVVILHGLRAWFENRGELRQEGQRVSRHYYDLHVMFRGETGEQALTDRALGTECIRHAQMFFNRPDFRLEAAAAGAFAVRPLAEMLGGLRRDYDAMAGMVFGPVPPFEDILESIAAIDERLKGVET
jgi:Nucleotidyl transferase AbiEii toxin, Type IV TA system